MHPDVITLILNPRGRAAFGWLGDVAESIGLDLVKVEDGVADFAGSGSADAPAVLAALGSVEKQAASWRVQLNAEAVQRAEIGERVAKALGWQFMGVKIDGKEGTATFAGNATQLRLWLGRRGNQGDLIVRIARAYRAESATQWLQAFGQSLLPRFTEGGSWVIS